MKITSGSTAFREGFVAKSSIVLVDGAKGFSPLRDDLRTPLMILMGMVLLLAAMTCVKPDEPAAGQSRGTEPGVFRALRAGRRARSGSAAGPTD